MRWLDDARAANAERIVQRVREAYPQFVGVRCRYSGDYLSYSLTFRPSGLKRMLFVRFPEERFDNGDWNWIFDAIEARMRAE